uniref:Uncharacterized protein n=1 Tax=Geospiza parvula TaxID=87175 RepID=A0A8C3N806_GEOPR
RGSLMGCNVSSLECSNVVPSLHENNCQSPTRLHFSRYHLSISDFRRSCGGVSYWCCWQNERRPTNFDKKVLVWSGRFKKEEDIPRHISSEVLDSARNIARIKVCYIMIALTVLGCVTMIISGKEAAKKDQTLLRVNAEKKAKWRAEVEKGQEAAVGKSQ